MNTQSLNLKNYNTTNTSFKPKIKTKRLLISESKPLVSSRNNDLSISNRVKRKTLKINSKITHKPKGTTNDHLKIKSDHEYQKMIRRILDEVLPDH